MMDDLISRAAAIKKFAEKREVWYGNGPLPSNESLMWQAAMSITEELPAVDAMPVVRCRDCKYYDRRWFTCENDVLLIKIDDCGCHPPFRVDDDWFCADGERRDSDG